MEGTSPSQLKSKMDELAEKWNSAYAEYCEAERNLVALKAELEMAQSDVSDFTRSTMAGHDIDEPDYTDLDEECYELDHYFEGQTHGKDFDDTISIIEDIQSLSEED